MKRIQGTILVECDICYHVNPESYMSTCEKCGHTVCLVCYLNEHWKCAVCGGNFVHTHDLPKK